MRWATYNRLEQQYDDLEKSMALGVIGYFGDLRVSAYVKPLGVVRGRFAQARAPSVSIEGHEGRVRSAWVLG
jgi:hypothetical protein